MPRFSDAQVPSASCMFSGASPPMTERLQTGQKSLDKSLILYIIGDNPVFRRWMAKAIEARKGLFFDYRYFFPKTRSPSRSYFS